ncbi:MAG: ATP-grasp fold amidoligase family protein [Tissierellia bacterium]|nr:ATP-grasp fold amidoligase family protein [Tissierellia bacterium]
MALHIYSNKTLRKVFFPLVFLTKWMGSNFPETLVRIRYFVRFHKFLNLKYPKTLNEKILYLSFRTDTTEWTRLTDKHAVRDYIKECGLEDILIPQYAHFLSADEIDYNVLPKRFVIKTTHGSGDILLVRDKSKIEISNVKKYFDALLKDKYGDLEGGKHYLRIIPSITVEALIENDEESAKFSTSIIDYKFWCFNGNPRYCWVTCNRTHAGVDVMTYDIDWNAHPEWSIFNNEYRCGVIMQKPKNYDYMLEVCKKLSEKFPCVSVDLYNIGGKVYFGEMTFTRLGGLINFFTGEWLLKAGSEIELGIKN